MKLPTILTLLAIAILAALLLVNGAGYGSGIGYILITTSVSCVVIAAVVAVD